MNRINKSGFSLMEMLVVMLIAAVIIALSAPMITKKLGSTTASTGSLWTSLTGGNIGFNTNSAGVSSIIGGGSNDISAMGKDAPKLVISTKKNYPHIGFLCNNKAAGILTLDDNNRIVLGNNSTAFGENSIVIGHHLKTRGNNSVALGGNINNTGTNSVAIGFDINNKKPDTIILGNENTTVVIPGKVRFNGISIGKNIDFDFNSILNAANMITKNKEAGIPLTVQDLQTAGPSHPNKDTITIKINGKPYYYQSDKRAKDIINENNDGLNKIKLLKVYNYTYKKDEQKIPHVGVMAQELRQVFPNAAQMDANGYLQIRHEDMFYALINAIKDLNKLIQNNTTAQDRKMEQLQTQIEKQRAMIISQNEEIKKLKGEITKLQTGIK